MELINSLQYPEEVVALLKYKFGKSPIKGLTKQRNDLPPASQRCYTYLNMTSRSFSAVIQALDGDLRHAVCVFYLVLRALDTVEDDMTIPNSEKVPVLKEFYKYLDQPDWKYMRSCEKDKLVLEDFPTISHEYRSLALVYREVISDICRQMGEGMTVFLERDLVTEKEWDEYCHYVAGVVGIGLSKLFSASGLESPEVGENVELSNSMGLFLQKTNIIRDYLEDLNEGRVFWPKEIWSKRGKSLEEFKHLRNTQAAIECLNELVANALEHIPDCMSYLKMLRNQSIFNFCAIPQVMAIATLERCFSNPALFRGVVKIRKGEAVRLMSLATDIDSVSSIFTFFTTEISKRISPNDPSKDRLEAAATEALKSCQTTAQYSQHKVYLPLWVSCSMMLTAVGWNYWTWFSWIATGSSDDPDQFN